ncbi:GDSL-type esterase/lipase family protein [Pseudoxanthomonas sp. UTMC 1351]|uniref:GDSL-type esterase/lipase family protein n=1 Tax=Pseudoxanthomonas sp. UTMC 1351 TaxID=2695853 RepID=UPI0034D019FD
MIVTRLRRIAVCAIALALSVAAHATPAPIWVPAWIASPAPDRLDGTPEAPLQFNDETVRQHMRLGTSATALRFRISNELGAQPLKIGAASARLIGAPAPALPVRFDGRSEVVIPTGGVLVSDPVSIAAPAFSEIALSIWFPEPTRPAVRRTTLRVVQGRSDVPDNTPLSYRQNVVSAVLAQRAHKPRVVVALGDSITEGATATRGTHGDWPALLAERLHRTCPDRVVVLNAGISGNKVLDNGRSHSALARLDRDVLALPGVDQVIVFEGINDIRHSGAPNFLPGRNAGEMIAGYRQILTRLQQHGIAVMGATLTPFGGSERYEPVSAETRRQINRFIRDGRELSAVIDFDAALRAPGNFEAMPAEITRDFLHPNDEGYRRMAASIDLSLFGCKVR